MLYLHSTNEIRVCVNDFLHFLCSLKLRIVLAKKTLGDFFLHPQYPTHNILRRPPKILVFQTNEKYMGSIYKFSN